MRASGQTIVNYFAENFAFLEELFNFSKKDNFFIDNEVLINRCIAKNINVKKLEEYKIAKPLAGGNYELNKRFTDFIAFLIDDFRLDLPESIKKYQNSIEEIYAQITLDNLTLNRQKTTNQIIELSNGLMNEIQEFGLQIEANTNQLFVETTKISENKNKLDYAGRISKATYLIENYIKPLNDILSKEHSNSFIKQLGRISDFANLQRHEQTDIGLNSQFQRLYQRILNISENILKNSSIMAKDVTPLIDRLRTENEIMKGIETFLLNAKRGKIEQKVCLSELKSRHKTYAKNFELSAKNILEMLKKQEPINFDNNQVIKQQDLWVFDKETYKEKLLQDLPINNFFNWCYQTLDNEDKENINSEKFYYISSLLFEKEIQEEFLLADKFEIDLTDYILKVPHIKINLAKNEN
ncbi:MAG: hypothetical protein EAZ44_02020 [Cytophagia bacterium]|nr:MAG: hypothetical protein EAZ44_02020 [Cytophagia bacterium]